MKNVIENTVQQLHYTNTTFMATSEEEEEDNEVNLYW